jgi:hypothetical protein
MSAATMYGTTVYLQARGMRRLPPWLNRAGALGFWFFLAKGLAWLAVPGVIAWLT